MGKVCELGWVGGDFGSIVHSTSHCCRQRMEKEPVDSADFDDDLKSLDDILGDLEQELIADFFYTWRWFFSSQDSATVI